MYLRVHSEHREENHETYEKLHSHMSLGSPANIYGLFDDFDVRFAIKTSSH